MKILLVEDDVFFQKFYSLKLSESGFTVTVASNGKEGMTKAQAEKPDLILLDLVMPVMDGFTVLSELSKNPSLKDIPVLVFSTLGQEQDVTRAKTLGAKDYVNKTFFDFENLKAKINALLVQNK